MTTQIPHGLAPDAPTAPATSPLEVQGATKPQEVDYLIELVTVSDAP